MKTFLCVFSAIGLIFNTTISCSRVESPNKTLYAGIWRGATEGNIKLTDLENCHGLRVFTAFSYRRTNYPIVSYEVVFIPKVGDVCIIENSGGKFSQEVKELLSQSMPGDQFVFREIKAKGEGNQILSLNSIPLTIK